MITRRGLLQYTAATAAVAAASHVTRAEAQAADAVLFPRVQDGENQDLGRDDQPLGRQGWAGAVATGLIDLHTGVALGEASCRSVEDLRTVMRPRRSKTQSTAS
jgi:hypothetical protein